MQDDSGAVPETPGGGQRFPVRLGEREACARRKVWAKIIEFLRYDPRGVAQAQK
jgi:hypothetical protein